MKYYHQKPAIIAVSCYCGGNRENDHYNIFSLGSATLNIDKAQIAWL